MNTAVREYRCPDRHEAARLLRSIRRAGPQDAGELVDWAFSLMPDRPRVRCLKVEQLLSQGDTDAAEALIAQGLRHRPDNCRLRLLHARNIACRGDVAHARAEAGAILEDHPDHLPSLRLATRLAIRARDTADVIEQLEAALARRENIELRQLLARALLVDGQTERAGHALAPLRDPDPLLLARIRRRQGRKLEAYEILARAAEIETDTEQRDRYMVDQLELLESIGDRGRLEMQIRRINARTPRAMLGGVSALLALGNYRAARRAVASLLRLPRYRWRALHLMIVAAALDDRPVLARQALENLRSTRRGVDTPLMSEAWRRGMLGAITRKHESAVRAGTDPSPSVLGTLLQRATRMFEVEQAATGDETDREHLGDCRRRCRLVLDRA